LRSITGFNRITHIYINYLIYKMLYPPIHKIGSMRS